MGRPKGSQNKTSKTSSNGSDKLAVAMLVLKHGGVAATKKALAKIQADELMSFATKHGGIERAIKLVDQLEAEIKVG